MLKEIISQRRHLHQYLIDIFCNKVRASRNAQLIKVRVRRRKFIKATESIGCIYKLIWLLAEIRTFILATLFWNESWCQTVLQKILDIKTSQLYDIKIPLIERLW